MIILLILILIITSISLFTSTRGAPKKKSPIKKVLRREGFVYVLSNPQFKEGVYKIGLTRNPIVERMKQLYNTSVPVAFQQEFALEVDDCVKVERELHVHFESKRINARREFFQLTLEDLEYIRSNY